ncbi:hypothetical protein [Saccharothrix yanglingensis]|uniref:hypothetical protein n=1 Tax=Saccharothrix yanglingensis TaxID=659496 RepID=UPI0027D24E17|nr:hypothetical protein [Saccharothrix yanglingensis]
MAAEVAAPLTVPADLPPTVDLAWRDPELERAARALVAGDTGPARALLAATHDPERRDLRVDVLGEAGQHVLPALHSAVDERHDADSLLLLGSALNAAAWEERGEAYAQYTEEDRLARFLDLADQARTALRRAAELAPDDVVPWAQLMSLALGAPEHDQDGDQVFVRVQMLCPDLVSANEHRLQMLADKWYGSHERMLEFARVRVSDLPAGHPLLALVPAAHVEVPLRDAESVSFRRRWRSIDYLARRVVRLEVAAVSDHLLAAGEVERGHPRWMRANQVFATYYAGVEAVAGLKREDVRRFLGHMAEAGERASRWPWSYFGDHHAEFAKARMLADKLS